jgi:hypothetical protein
MGGGSKNRRHVTNFSPRGVFNTKSIQSINLDGWVPTTETNARTREEGENDETNERKRTDIFGVEGGFTQ